MKLNQVVERLSKYNRWGLAILLVINVLLPLRVLGTVPLITRMDAPEAPDGLDGAHIAMWNSHGYYYHDGLKKWLWQRPRLFGTVEDLFPTAYVLDFLAPMLENAGAVVMIPRERDTSTEEILPKAHLYGKWSQDGFAQTRKDEKGAPSASFKAKFARSEPKAVYIKYESDSLAPNDAMYRINSLRGTEEFRVNQQIGGGIWIYLGTFPFAAGDQKEPVVEVIAQSDEPGTWINAGEVKIGGGMGSVVRGGKVSGMPRWAEGAKYFLQYSGVPDSIISQGESDYKEDYMCRGRWVNYLAGGSERIPNAKGLGIPVDLSLAFHTDAGVTQERGNTIGTLPIVCTAGDTLGDGTSRARSLDLARAISGEVVNDTRRLFDHSWRARKLMDKHYHEASSPQVPAVLLELLSHQNFDDMLVGLDPEYQFAASRAIYKGILKFLADRDRRLYVVQPLPVKNFAITGNKDKYKLVWEPTPDPSEESAMPEYYIVYESIDNGPFTELAVIKKTSLDVKVQKNKLYSYKVVAVNSGGTAFPSEILSLGYVGNDKPQVLVVNGFYSATLPKVVSTPDSLGFDFAADHGAGYMRNINFVGEQTEFTPGKPCVSDHNAGTGFSKGNYAAKPFAGNTFDFPRLHGQAIMAAGYSFVSTSAGAWAKNKFKASIVDVILGKQGGVASRRPAFTPELKTAINRTCGSGSSLLISGCYIGSELFNDTTGLADKMFASQNLGLIWCTSQATRLGQVHTIPSPLKMFKPATYKFNQELREDSYAAESPDAFLPRVDCAEIMRYGENATVAGTAFTGPTHKAVTLGFPFETIAGQQPRERLMKEILSFLNAPNAKKPKVDPAKTATPGKNQKKKKKK